MNLSLEGRNAVICGSTQGIGFAITEELALMGANCILLARNEESLQTAVAQLDTALRQTHSFSIADFSHPEQVKETIERIVAKQNIHILINNTGGPPAEPIADAKPEEFVPAFSQHLVCNHILTQAVTPVMKSKRTREVVEDEMKDVPMKRLVKHLKLPPLF